MVEVLQKENDKLKQEMDTNSVPISFFKYSIIKMRYTSSRTTNVSSIDDQEAFDSHPSRPVDTTLRTSVT